MRKLHVTILLIVVAAIAAPACHAEEKLDTAPIISALIEVAKDDNENVRYVAFSALKTQPHSDELLKLFWQGLDDDSPRIQTLSLDKVVELEGPSEKLLERLILLAKEPAIVTVSTDRMQRQVQSHLISLGAPAIPYLIEALKKDPANYVAISALGRIPLGEHRSTVTTLLTALLENENSSVQIVAVQSLQSIMIADAEAKAKAAKAKALAEALAEGGGIDPRYLAYYTKLLQKYDSNGNGSLTKDEWSKMSKDPAAADANQDGVITAVELGKWSQIR